MDIRTLIRSAICIDGAQANVNTDRLAAVVDTCGLDAVSDELHEMAAHDMADTAHAAAKELGLKRVEDYAARVLKHSGSYAYRP